MPAASIASSSTRPAPDRHLAPQPDAKWRLTPTDLAELTELQAKIIDSARGW